MKIKLKSDVVVLFSTFNGEDVLADVLNGYIDLIQDEISWTILAVNNNSNDKTQQILESFKSKLPIIILEEGLSGKARSLNTALDSIETDADFFIITDDDAIPSKDFIQAWALVLASQPNSDIFGGVINPFFRTPPPPWLTKFEKHFSELYAKNVRKDGPISPDCIYGPNMAVRSSIFKQGFRFNENIGPNSNRADYPMGDETEFCVRVTEATGKLAYFTTKTSVSHIVRPRQMTLNFVIARAKRHGRGVAMRQMIARNISKNISLRSSIKHAGRMLIANIFNGSLVWNYYWHEGFRSYIRENHS